MKGLRNLIQIVLIYRLPLVIVVVLAGCGGDEQSRSDEAAENRDIPARTEAEKGPVKVILTIEPREPRLSDNPTLTLSIEASEGIDVKMPPFGESVGDFLIKGFRRPLPESRGDIRITRQVYELEPVRTGEHLIHPITIPFIDNRPQGDGQEHLIESEGLTITVQSVLGDTLPSLAELEPPEPPMELPEEPWNPLWLLLGLPLVAAPVLFYYVRWRRRRAGGESAAPRLSPGEMAYLELEELIEAGYLERGELALYYEGLTGVVRRFIERTTSIRAPEQTTEEFLREASRGEVFSVGEQRSLQAFLEAADLVKFAARRPQNEEIEASFNLAKAFIGLGGDRDERENAGSTDTLEPASAADSDAVADAEDTR